MGSGERRRAGAKEAEWREVLAKFAASELSVRAFCARERLSEPSFYAWRRELARRDLERLATGPRNPRQSSPRTASRRQPSSASPSFVPVKLTGDATAGSAAAIEVRLPTGVLLRVPSGCDPATLHAVLTALASTEFGAAAC